MGFPFIFFNDKLAVVYQGLFGVLSTIIQKLLVVAVDLRLDAIKLVATSIVRFTKLF